MIAALAFLTVAGLKLLERLGVRAAWRVVTEDDRLESEARKMALRQQLRDMGHPAFVDTPRREAPVRAGPGAG